MHPTKFVSILQNVPMKPRSAWQVYIREHLKGTKTTQEGLTKSSTELSAKWKALSEHEKQKYYTIYESEKDAYEKAFAVAVNNASPKQFYQENLLRKKYKLPLLVDPKKPKRPLNAYLSYYQVLRDSKHASMEGQPVAEQAKIVGRLYKELPESEKKIYKDKANQAMEQYKKQVAEYNREAEIQRINQREISSGNWSDDASWHAQYKDSAWIFAGGMSYDLTEGDIVCIFSQYGEIMHVLLVRDRKTGKSKGFAFLQYEDQRSTILAVDNLNGATVLGRVLRVDHSFGPKKHKRRDDDEESEEEGPMMNVAPELIEVVGEDEIKEKKKKKKVESFEDNEDPMAEYFRKKKKKSKHHKRSRRERSRSLSPRRSSRSPSHHRERSPSPRRRSRSPQRRSRSPSYKSRSSRYRSRSPRESHRYRSPSPRR
ncbi:hypothetical protein G6F18_004646 [Rhizopus arrhizus]|nr:hypothetical protein G6F18_004646 [Rhizopus arrhizus]